jgi:Pre-mRNA-splicing factor of RES complex
VQAEKERFEKLDASVTGKGAATVYRDKEGRIVDEDQLKQQREAERKPKHEAPTWGAGLKQVGWPWSFLCSLGRMLLLEHCRY